MGPMGLEARVKVNKYELGVFYGGFCGGGANNYFQTQNAMATLGS